VDAARSRDGDAGVFDYRMICPGIDPGGKDMDKLDTAATSVTNCVIGMKTDGYDRRWVALGRGTPSGTHTWDSLPGLVVVEIK
jgi:hypothetical protein